MKKYVCIRIFILLLLCTILSSCGGAGRGSKKPDAKADQAAAGENCDSEYTDIPDEESGELSGATKKLVDQSQSLYANSGEHLKKKDYDKALTALDEAYSKLLKIDLEERGGDFQQIEDLRFMISKRIMEIYAIRNKGGIPAKNEIPIVLNPHVNREIKSLTTNERSFFVAALSRSAKYRPMIVAKLKEAGIPAELAWLPLIESGYKVSAYSSARALGMWQFIASTGHRYGLKRDEYIDERMDPEKSTDAAIAYLKELHQMFGDWETVLSAYNCGEGRVLRTIRTQNINYLDNFWDLYGKLPVETARYVPRFIATIHIINNLKDYDLADVAYEAPVNFETVTVSKRVSLKDLGSASGVSECLLRDLNPELRHGILPPTTYSLKVPVNYSDKILASVTVLQDAAPPRPEKVTAASSNGGGGGTYHKVSKGETIVSIARKYNKSVYELISSNNLNKKSKLSAGKLVRIPDGSETKSQKTVSKKDSAKPIAKSGSRPASVEYKVKKGDTVWTIAKNYGTTPDRIISMNKLSGSSVRVGTVIKIDASADPGLTVSSSDAKASVQSKPDNREKSSKQAAVKTTASSGQAAYKVKQGDNIFSIARQHNISVDRILALNRLPKDTKIFPGQSLHVE